MTPTSGDVRGGIRNWADDNGGLGNFAYGDCDIAAFEQLRKCHEVISANNAKKVLYKLGFRPPHTPYTIDVYAQYLATLGEKPSATNGVSPGAFFAWAQTKGMIKDWGSVPPSGPTFALTDLPAVEEAMLAHRGVILGVTLTPNAYGAQAKPGGHWVTGTEKDFQPAPGLFHAVALVAYTPQWLTAVTWCFQVKISPEWFATCCWGAWWFDLVD